MAGATRASARGVTDMTVGSGDLLGLFLARVMSIRCCNEIDQRIRVDVPHASDYDDPLTFTSASQ